MSKLPLLLILIALCFACTAEEQQPQPSQTTTGIDLPQKYDSLKNISTYPADAEAPYDITFTKEVVFGTGSDIILSGFGSFEVGENDSVYISSGRSIVVFDENGSFIKRMGREGRGPGEFKNMVTLNPRYYSDKLFAYDDVLRRVTIFNTRSLSYLESFNIDYDEIQKIEELLTSYLSSIYPYNDSLLIAEFEDLYSEDRPEEIGKETLYKRYYLINYSSEIVSTELFRFSLNPNNTKGLNYFIPFRNQSDRYSRISFAHDGNIYLTESEDFLIKVFSMEGEYLRSIYYPVKNVSFDKEKVIETFDFSKTAHDRAKSYDFPDTWPVIDQFFTDDENRLWVSTITESDNTFTWWVLNNDGSLRAQFDWPGKRIERDGRFRIPPKVRDGFFYMVGENNETGDAIITKYKIEFVTR